MTLQKHKFKSERTWRLGIGTSSLYRGKVILGCAGLSSFSCKANKQLSVDLFSPTRKLPVFFISQTFLLHSITLHSTLSSKQTSLLCNISKHRQQMKCSSHMLKKVNRRKSRMNEGKNKQSIENLLGIQVKIMTGSSNRGTSETKLQHRSNQIPQLHRENFQNNSYSGCHTRNHKLFLILISIFTMPRNGKKIILVTRTMTAK